jgi:ribonuclease VapC
LIGASAIEQGYVVVSAVSLLEAGIFLRARLGESATGLLNQLVEVLVSKVILFDGSQAGLAIAAFRRFGKGMGRGGRRVSRD